ncbi:hypothetical protein PR202_ga00481 [Eleusine coracana subsp. coracana]|uniref:Uncharacterized protein n=1 Tax=Eleusine coracana subsp. coracana TaxID=191504 RepID=A0AAV5BH58_ELECO|nr:hypothetical protein PR202_ga00481 [Eleusine coracana subsp. coracana]
MAGLQAAGSGLPWLIWWTLLLCASPMWFYSGWAPSKLRGLLLCENRGVVAATTAVFGALRAGRLAGLGGRLANLVPLRQRWRTFPILLDARSRGRRGPGPYPVRLCFHYAFLCTL